MNFYSVLDDSDDEDTPKTPKPVVVKKETESKPQAAGKSAPKGKVAPAATEAPIPAKAANTNAKSGNKEKKENAPRNSTPAAAAPAAATTTFDVNDASKASERGGSRDNRKRDGRGGRGGRGDKANNGDRRKTSGRGRGSDRDGRGPYNWGNAAEESRLAEKNPELANPDTEAGDEADGQSPAVIEIVEPEVPQLTYEEFVAQRNQARANQDIFGAVKERAVERDLAGIQIKDAGDLTDFMVLGEEKSKTKSAKEQRSAALAKQMLLDVGFKNAALEANRERDDGDRGSRGGRGNDRRSGGGRGGRGSPTSRASSGANIDLSDTSAFPSL